MSRSEIVKERPIQTKAFDSVTKLLETRGECLVKMFCGTGKSRVMKRLIMEQKKSLSIIVFPSLALIRQFTNDYLRDTETRVYGIMNVSSEELKDITSTTDPAQIHHFLNNPKTKHQKKIICVTYQSLDVLLSSIGDTKIGIACFDEAHRTTSPEAKELVYGDEYRAKYEKRVFFTATPVNANGITMFDRERDEMGTHGDCGPLACEYTYLQGLRDAILSLFELRIDLYTQDTLGNMYESIARAILTTGNTRVLTFHTDAAAESDSETSVLRFVDKAKFVEAFRAVCAKEFPDKAGKFADDRITFTAITAETKNKDAILSAFETCSDDEIYIVASCRTIGEGVDTKKANMCVFVDPKSSVISIIQNIGRICRKIAGSERQPATILIPVCIGWEKYREAGDDPEVQDKLIREQLNDRENGDYNAIMNIVAALKQEDPELYELCLRYPSKFTESERKHALEEQGFRVLEDDDDDAGDDAEPNVLYPEDIDELVENGDRVEIHTSNVDVPIVYRGFDDEACDEEEEERPIQRFYEVEEENDDGEMETRYHRIAPVNEEGEEEEDSNRRLNPPKATNRPRMNIHTNDEIKLLWKIGDVAIGEQFGSGVLECEVERMDRDELWMEKHQKMCEFIDEKRRVPSTHSKEPEEKRLAGWVGTQKGNYNSSGAEMSKRRMKNPNIWQIWTDTLNDPKYCDALADFIQIWKNNHHNMCEFIDKEHKVPPSASVKYSPEIQKLGRWVGTQKGNYDPRGSEFSTNLMKKHLEIWQIWNDTLSDPKYNKHLCLDPIQEWKNRLYKTCKFINDNGKQPSVISKDKEEITLGHWLVSQKKNYHASGPEISKDGMKNTEIWQTWTNTLADPMYSEVLADFIQIWNNNHSKMCEFIEKNGYRPSSTSKCPEEKKVGSWVCNQITNYDVRGSDYSKRTLKQAEIWKIWNDTLINPIYCDALATPVQEWKSKHKKLCDYINKNQKGPKQTGSKDPEEKILGKWLSHQKCNYDPHGPEFSKNIMKSTPEIWKIWTDTLANEIYSDSLVLDPVQDWKKQHNKVCKFIDKHGKIPSTTTKDTTEKTLVNWTNSQKKKYDPRGPAFSKEGMKNPDIWQIWTETIQKYPCLKKQGQETQCPPPSPPIQETSQSKPKPRLVIKKSHLIPNPSLECSAPVSTPNPSTPKRVITDSPYKLTGRAWATQKSTTTHEKLQSNPAEWRAYHAARDISFQGYADQSQIPRNRIIAHLANKRKHRLRILDLGCGRNNIAQHYADVDKNHKFAIQGYDHIAEEGSGALVGNIADLAAQEEDESADICIYSQSLMGSDWRNYLTEGHRMLRYNGEFIISEHIKLLDDVRAELGRLGCKVESVNADAGEAAAEAEDADDKVAKWFVLVARKV